MEETKTIYTGETDRHRQTRRGINRETKTDGKREAERGGRGEREREE